MPGTFDYHNFSWRGDPRWAEASRFTIYGPIVVVVIFVLSIAELSLGALWISSLLSTMTIAKILQPILLPGLSFFNALPSLHLHLLVRSNPPTLALWFSTSFAILYLTSSLLLVTSCTSTSVSQSLRQTECAVGTAGGPSIGISKGAWSVFVAFNFLSTVMYLCHAGMAFYVKKVMKHRIKTGILEVEDPEKVEARKQKARDLWVKATSAQGL